MKKIFLTTMILLASSSYAGNQQYEELKNETRNMMSQMVADQPPKYSSFPSKEAEKIWVKKYESSIKRFSPDSEERELLLKTIHYEAIRAGLEPELILGLIRVESGFNKYAVSSVKARGFMQVMPFWVDLIGDKTHNLFHMRTNLRYGCTILRHYLDIERGNMFRALGRYNGSLGRAEYPNAVMAASKTFKNKE